MKIIELNIGLTSKALGQLNYIEVLNALTGRGFECIKYRLVESVSQDGPETCLAYKGKAPADWQDQLASLSDNYGQDCIAIAGFIGQSPYDAFCADLWVSSDGDSVAGLHDLRNKPETISDCARLLDRETFIFSGVENGLAKFITTSGNIRHLNRAWIKELCLGDHRLKAELIKGWNALGEKTEERFNDFTRQEFLNYLEFSIIPDSKESGHEGYAEDLETALHFLRNP